MEIGQIASYMQKSAENTTKMQEFKGGMSVRPFLPPKHPKIDPQNTPFNTTLVERERSATKQTCHKTHQDRRRDVEVPFKLKRHQKNAKTHSGGNPDDFLYKSLAKETHIIMKSGKKCRKNKITK